MSSPNRELVVFIFKYWLLHLPFLPTLVTLHFMKQHPHSSIIYKQTIYKNELNFAFEDTGLYKEARGNATLDVVNDAEMHFYVMSAG